MWPFGKRKADHPPDQPQREYRYVLVSEGEGWIERRAWLDQAGSLWAASGDGYSILELVEGGKVKPASAHHQQMYGFERRWRDAPKPKAPRP